MNTDTLNRLASDLASARGGQQQISAEPFAALGGESEAYQLQQQAIDAYDSPCIGYKVGATSPAAQKLFNCDRPFFGPMFEREHHSSGAQLPCFKGILGGEAEFAFRCGSDFPAHENLATSDLPALIEQCHIAVEMVGRRTAGDGLPPLLTAIADFGANIAFLSGDAVTDWAQHDLSAVQVSATVNGVETNRGSSADVMGNPLNSLLWLHNTLLSHGKSLKRGDWVSTGTCLGVIAATPGTRVNIEFEGLGTIDYQLS